MSEILATIDDINANLPTEGNVVKADDANTSLLQISVARVVRGYLSRAIDNTTLMSWSEPAATPDVVREAAGMLIASQLYFNQTAATSLDIDVRNFAQLLYDKAIALLQGIIEGTIILPTIVVDSIESMSALDFFPVDDTDRAFTMGLRL